MATAAPAPDPVEAWVQMWDGAEALVTDPAAAREAITAVATDEVYEQLDLVYNPTIEGQSEVSTPRVFDNNPVVEEQADGSAVIDDCLFESPRAGNQTVWYRGSASLHEGSWRVESLDVVNQVGCVPEAVADAVLAGYDAYWDARLEFWDPADPDHPLVAETLTGPQLELVRRLLADHQERGLALRGRHTSHYEIIEVRSQAEVVVRDCVDQDPGRGLFVIESGERLDDVAPIEEGQRDFLSAVVVFEEGRWKVSDVQDRAKTACEYPPSPQGLPVV